MADGDLVALQIVAVGRSFFHVPRRRRRPYLATPVSFQDFRIRAFLLSFFHDNGTCDRVGVSTTHYFLRGWYDRVEFDKQAQGRHTTWF